MGPEKRAQKPPGPSSTPWAPRLPRRGESEIARTVAMDHRNDASRTENDEIESMEVKQGALRVDLGFEEVRHTAPLNRMRKVRKKAPKKGAMSVWVRLVELMFWVRISTRHPKMELVGDRRPGGTMSTWCCSTSDLLIVPVLVAHLPGHQGETTEGSRSGPFVGRLDRFSGVSLPRGYLKSSPGLPPTHGILPGVAGPDATPPATPDGWGRWGTSSNPERIRTRKQMSHPETVLDGSPSSHFLLCKGSQAI